MRTVAVNFVVFLQFFVIVFLTLTPEKNHSVKSLDNPTNLYFWLCLVAAVSHD